MFKRLNTSASNSQTTTSSPGPSRTHPELKELDSRLKVISDTIIQRTPYILTVPSERPYNLDPRLAREWKRGTPFDDNEEQLQYLSFLADWDDGLIRPVGGWDNDHGEIMDRSQSQQSARSATSNSASKKVKYSLSDYKKKAAGQPISTGSKDADGSPKVNGKPTAPRSPPQQRDSNKRPREDGGRGVLHSPKRRRSSPEASATPPPTKRPSPPTILELPPDISPTLPAAIEKELARLDKLEALDAPRKEKSKDSLLDSRHHDSVAEKRSSAKENLSKKKDRPSDRDSIRPKDDDRQSNASLNGIPSKTNKPVDADGSASQSKPSKILRLRIPKSIRNNVIRLLKTPPRRPKPNDTAHKGVARRIGHTSPPPTRDRSREREKRPRTEDDDDGRSAIKRAKHPAGLDVSKPSTPIPAAFRSPVMSHHGSSQKQPAASDSQKKSLSAYHDDGHASTPAAAIRNGTPTAPESVERGTKDARPSGNGLPRPQRSAFYSELRQTEIDMFTLGRSSKHNSDRELNGDEESARRTMRGLAFGLECILAFMLSYTVRDEMNRMHPPEGASGETWTTIFPYIKRIKRIASSSEHKYLRGLCQQLEAVCHMAAWTNECERAAAASSASPPSTATLMKHYHSAMGLFVEGATTLSVDALQHAFPQTWAAKSSVPLASRPSTSSGSASNGSGHRFDPRPDGEFALPITSITTGVEAVRAGRALLIEWCATQRLEWSPSLGAKKKDAKEGRL